MDSRLLDPKPGWAKGQWRGLERPWAFGSWPLRRSQIELFSIVFILFVDPCIFILYVKKVFLRTAHRFPSYKRGLWLKSGKEP
jgi:hypothetical protein